MKSTRKRAVPDFVRDAITQGGGRMTVSRQKIVTYLANASKPVSIQDMLRDISVDQVNVYRTVALLKEKGLIEEIVFPDGSHRFALAHAHHHHAICSSCDRVLHIPCGNQDRFTNARVTGFSTILGHSVTYFGICTTCKS